MNRYGMKSKGDRDDRHRIDLISFARNYACWDPHTEGSREWHCTNPMHRCVDVKSVALTKISVDQMVERDAGVGRRGEGAGACLRAGKSRRISNRGASLIEFPVAIILRFYTGTGHASSRAHRGGRCCPG